MASSHTVDGTGEGSAAVRHVRPGQRLDPGRRAAVRDYASWRRRTQVLGVLRVYRPAAGATVCAPHRSTAERAIA
jgi:hypothetical protein